jgi:hypothetical protein
MLIFYIDKRERMIVFGIPGANCAVQRGKMNRARPELPFSVTVKGDAAIVRFLAAAEILESDLWE